MKLKELKQKIDGALANPAGLDAYSIAHLTECQLRITKAMDAIYIYNQPSGGGAPPLMIFGQPAPGLVAPVGASAPASYNSGYENPGYNTGVSPSSQPTSVQGQSAEPAAVKPAADSSTAP